jgi:hypothetical protein
VFRTQKIDLCRNENARFGTVVGLTRPLGLHYFTENNSSITSGKDHAAMAATNFVFQIARAQEFQF